MTDQERRVAFGPSEHARRAIAAEAERRRRVRRRIVSLMLVGAAILGFALMLGGCCVSKTEYRELVKASRAFYDATRPDAIAAIASERLDEQSRRNRLGLWDDYGLTLEAAEKRAAK